MFGKEHKCDCCKMKFVRGIRIDGTEYYDHLGRKDRWSIKKHRRKYYICEKCWSTWTTLIRNHLAVKTSDIMTR